MDLIMWPARWLAGPLSKLLAADGRSPQDRRAEILHDMALPGDDSIDLALRHLTRGVAWLLVLGATFIAVVGVSIPLSLLVPADPDNGDPALAIGMAILFTPFFLACLHLAKAGLAWKVLAHRWNPRNRVWRIAMLAQTPDLIIASAAAVAVGLSAA